MSKCKLHKNLLKDCASVTELDREHFTSNKFPLTNGLPQQRSSQSRERKIKVKTIKGEHRMFQIHEKMAKRSYDMLPEIFSLNICTYFQII